MVSLGKRILNSRYIQIIQFIQIRNKDIIHENHIAMGAFLNIQPI